MSVDRRLDAAQYDVAVVGGGVAGLAAAAECLRIGLRVVVLEAAEQVGGSVSPLELAGSRSTRAPRASPPAEAPSRGRSLL